MDGINTYGNRGFEVGPISPEVVVAAGGRYGYARSRLRAPLGRPRKATPEKVLKVIEQYDRPVACIEICEALGLCRETATALLHELITRGDIKRGLKIRPTGGRRVRGGDKFSWHYWVEA